MNETTLCQLQLLEEKRNHLAEIGYAYEQRLRSSALSCSSSPTSKSPIGSHYTPVEMASRVVKTALKPLLYHEDGSPKTREEVLALRVYDPAVGAGIFLLETCVQLTVFLAEQGENAAEITPQIVKNCLFGSDLDAEAVEITRQVLRKIAFIDEKSEKSQNLDDRSTIFSTLEEHILCADSLKLWKPFDLKNNNKYENQNSHDSFVQKFDLVIGNPPFLGGRKIRRMFGDAYFRYLTQEFTQDGSGNADLCAYFLRLAERIVRPGGACGFITTNTIAEGDSRRTGLDVLLANGAVIYNVETCAWTGDAAVQVTLLHLFFPEFGEENARKTPMNLKKVLYGNQVAEIYASLKHLDTKKTSRIFPKNESYCFQGYVLAAKGFILTPSEAFRLWEADEKYKEVIVPYFTGDDVFSSTDPMRMTPRRFVIFFHDWTLEHAEEFPLALEIVRERVLPTRLAARRKAHRENWWLFGDKRPTFTKIIQNNQLKEVLIQTRHAKFLCPTRVPAANIYSESTVLFPTESRKFQAILNSSIHEIWVRETTSSLGNEMRYSPTDCFYTFPFPHRFNTTFELFEYRAEYCRMRQKSLTELYNWFHSPQENSDDIRKLRELHHQNDSEVLSAYGWNDLELIYEFHPTLRGVRWELLPKIQEEILRRLSLSDNFISEII